MQDNKKHTALTVAELIIKALSAIATLIRAIRWW